MKLASIYIKGHYLFKKDQTINFGGKFIYEFKNINSENVIEINRKGNNNYIDSFWGNNISLVSTIVGENGTGKTSLINTILLNLNNTNVGIIDCDLILMIFETEDDIIEYTRNYTEDEISVKTINFEKNKRNLDISTIFYTPILDIRELYIDHSNTHYIDISKYRLFQNDTESEEGNFSKLSEFHLSENLKRWIFFISEFKSDIQSDFIIPEFSEIKISINRVLSLLNEPNNIPNDFRDFPKAFYEKWQNEYHKKSHSTKRKRLELNLLLAVIEKMFNILEKTGNIYLEEGKLKITLKDIENLSLKDSLYLFLDNHYFIKFRSVRLPIEEIKELIEILIDNLPQENEIISRNNNSYTVSNETALKIMNSYQKFIRAFSKDFTFDKNIMLTFKPNIDLSTGEKGLLDLFSSFYEIKEKISSDNLLIFIDEGDTSFHPEWKIKFVNSILNFFPKIISNKTLQFVFTTHDSLTLSDIPNTNVVYLKKEGTTTKILLEQEKPTKSFGANITDLLADSFFIKDGLIGDFAKEKIDQVIKYLNDNESLIADKVTAKKVIEIIDEPILKYKLEDMFFEKFPEEHDLEKEKEELLKRAQELGLNIQR